MADYLSRVGHEELPRVMQCLSVQVADGKVDGVYRLRTLLSIEELKTAQQTCPAVGPVIEVMKSGKQVEVGKEAEWILKHRKYLSIVKDGIRLQRIERKLKCKTSLRKDEDPGGGATDDSTTQVFRDCP